MTKEKVKKCVTAAVVVGGAAIVVATKLNSSGSGKSDYEESGIYGREKNKYTVVPLDNLLEKSH